MSNDLIILIFLLTAGAFLAGWYGEKWRARRARKAWSAKRPARNVVKFAPRAGESDPPGDAVDQLRAVIGATFRKRRLMSRSEAQVFYAAENAISAQRLDWRVMAQVSLGEILSSPDDAAYRAINSKRVDILLISRTGEPLAAVEYQGEGHHQGSAPARDAVKREALRLAGVAYIEITPAHPADELARAISRVAEGARASS